MKVTEDGNKYRQSQKEGYPQNLAAEQGRYVEAYDPSKITENNITDTNLATDYHRQVRVVN
jgi:RNA-directed DNA polymerase